MRSLSADGSADADRIAPLGRRPLHRRANVTTTDTTAVVASQARVKNQITGYNLTGLGAMTTTVVNDGPAVGSCPADRSDFDEGSIVQGDEIVLSSGLFVNGISLPITPAVIAA